MSQTVRYEDDDEEEGIVADLGIDLVESVLKAKLTLTLSLPLTLSLTLTLT